MEQVVTNAIPSGVTTTAEAVEDTVRGAAQLIYNQTLSTTVPALAADAAKIVTALLAPPTTSDAALTARGPKETGIFGGLARAFTGKPPKLKAGEVVRWVSAPTRDIFAATLLQRPYAVRLDDNHQEDGDRRWPERQTFTDPSYMGAWQTWAERGRAAAAAFSGRDGLKA